MSHENVLISANAWKEAEKDRIEYFHVMQVPRNGDVIEEHRRRSRYLMHCNVPRSPEGLRTENPRLIPVHVVCEDIELEYGPATLVVTTYDPRTEPDEWTNDFRKRRGDQR